MNRTSLTCMLMALSTPAFGAGPEQGRFAFSLFGTGDVPLSGDVHDGAIAPVPNLGPLNPALEGVSAELRIGSRTHEDIYDMATGGGGEFTWGLSDRSEVFGQLRYVSASEGTVQVGDAFVPLLNASLPVYGTFSDYKAWSAEIGYRWYFMAPDYARPYVAARLGGTRTDEIRATFDIPDANINIANAPFYEEGWAVSAGIDLGVIIPFNDNFSVMAETGVRYTGDLKDDDSAIGGLGLASINDTGQRVSMPLTLALRYDF